eukprot:TRINITY_DN8474_c0_g1_i1.p1 TRINITY_DN8474_c0_g1~~TRINITY_DN8474_c0_g1_i1.p1  ORF type:complete len:116 (-),score=31.26 TRINITY_DN8474_c0_g1_i1:278-625(-)
MGLMQLIFDAAVGTTALALARRAGVFPAPKLDAIKSLRTRELVRRYLQFGQDMLEGFDSLRGKVGQSKVGPSDAQRKQAEAAARKAAAASQEMLRDAPAKAQRFAREMQEKMRGR